MAAWKGGEFGGEWIHVHVWLSPFAAHLKLHCNWLCSNMKLKVNKFLKIEILKSRPKSTAHEFLGEQPENLHFNKCLAQVTF